MNVFPIIPWGYNGSTRHTTLYILFIFLYRITIILYKILHNLCISNYSLQNYNSSTGDTTQFMHFLFFPIELTEALQEILYRINNSYYSLQGHNSSTKDYTQYMRFLQFPIELQQLHKTCYTICAYPTIPYKVTIALQEMFYNGCVSYYFLQSSNSSTGNPTLLCGSYYSLQSYWKYYSIYAIPNIP